MDRPELSAEYAGRRRPLADLGLSAAAQLCGYAAAALLGELCGPALSDAAAQMALPGVHAVTAWLAARLPASWCRRG